MNTGPAILEVVYHHFFFPFATVMHFSSSYGFTFQHKAWHFDHLKAYSSASPRTSTLLPDLPRVSSSFLAGTLPIEQSLLPTQPQTLVISSPHFIYEFSQQCLVAFAGLKLRTLCFPSAALLGITCVLNKNSGLLRGVSAG